MVAPSISVEFLGLPGAGKSVVCQRVKQALEDGGRVVDEPTLDRGAARRYAEKLIAVSGEILVRPRRVLRSVRAIAATRQSSPADLRRSLLNWIFVSALLRRHGRRPGIHLLDQGIFQALWSVGYGGDSGAVARVADQLAKSMPLPSVVVVVEASVERVARRLRERRGGDSRLERLLDREPGLLERSTLLLQETLAVLLSLSQRRGHPRVIMVKNEEEPDAWLAASEVTRVLERILGADASGSVAELGAQPLPRLP